MLIILFTLPYDALQTKMIKCWSCLIVCVIVNDVESEIMFPIFNHVCDQW